MSVDEGAAVRKAEGARDGAQPRRCCNQYLHTLRHICLGAKSLQETITISCVLNFSLAVDDSVELLLQPGGALVWVRHVYPWKTRLEVKQVIRNTT